jgi:hypothetical protein
VSKVVTSDIGKTGTGRNGSIFHRFHGIRHLLGTFPAGLGQPPKPGLDRQVLAVFDEMRVVDAGRPGGFQFIDALSLESHLGPPLVENACADYGIMPMNPTPTMPILIISATPVLLSLCGFSCFPPFPSFWPVFPRF